MANTNPARGMRDFLPSDVRKRNYVIGIIKEVYESYGFEPLETPAVENIETLTGKYGEEGNQLIFKILKRRESFSDELDEFVDDVVKGFYDADNPVYPPKVENYFCDLALRYDLTVPLARVVANHKNDLPKFFKRYQIQPVWRADRPARGRYREFYQCDVDAIGSSSMIVEAELISAVCEILQKLGFEKYQIHINHRNFLSEFLSSFGLDVSQHYLALIVVDKKDKISAEAAKKELLERNIPENISTKIVSFLVKIKDLAIQLDITDLHIDLWSEEVFAKWNEQILFEMNNLLSEIGKDESIKQLKQLLDFCQTTFAKERIVINPGLARGLSYYTGTIMEINIGGGIGSVGGGGRYDGLIGMFGKEQIPAVGFSLGLERILLIMEERGMFPKELSESSADVLVTVWNEESISESLKLAAELRKQNLRVLVYPEADKLGKQFKYADSIKIPFVCVLGENELAENKVTLKNLQTGEQETIDRKDVSKKLKV